MVPARGGLFPRMSWCARQGHVVASREQNPATPVLCLKLRPSAHPRTCPMPVFGAEAPGTSCSPTSSFLPPDIPSQGAVSLTSSTWTSAVHLLGASTPGTWETQWAEQSPSFWQKRAPSPVNTHTTVRRGEAASGASLGGAGTKRNSRAPQWFSLQRPAPSRKARSFVTVSHEAEPKLFPYVYTCIFFYGVTSNFISVLLFFYHFGVPFSFSFFNFIGV